MKIILLVIIAGGNVSIISDIKFNIWTVQYPLYLAQSYSLEIITTDFPQIVLNDFFALYRGSI